MFWVCALNCWGVCIISNHLVLIFRDTLHGYRKKENGREGKRKGKESQEYMQQLLNKENCTIYADY